MRDYIKQDLKWKLITLITTVVMNSISLLDCIRIINDENEQVGVENVFSFWGIAIILIVLLNGKFFRIVNTIIATINSTYIIFIVVSNNMIKKLNDSIQYIQAPDAGALGSGPWPRYEFTAWGILTYILSIVVLALSIVLIEQQCRRERLTKEEHR